MRGVSVQHLQMRGGERWPGNGGVGDAARFSPPGGPSREASGPFDVWAEGPDGRCGRRFVRNLRPECAWSSTVESCQWHVSARLPGTFAEQAYKHRAPSRFSYWGGGRKWECRRTRRLTKNTGGGALAKGYLKIESVRDDARAQQEPLIPAPAGIQRPIAVRKTGCRLAPARAEECSYRLQQHVLLLAERELDDAFRRQILCAQRHLVVGDGGIVDFEAAGLDLTAGITV